MLRKILTPITINKLEIPNRVVRTSHGTHFGHGVNDENIGFHEARARGGVGLTILEIAAVHPTSPAPICSFDDDIVSEYEKLMRAVRPHGMRVFQQLWHGGHHVGPSSGLPPWSASDVPSVISGAVPLAMSRGQIDEVTDAFASAALRCKDGGIDGVELHAAHSYLPQQFLSPLTNKRTDEYGGCFPNRLRFVRGIMEAIRNKVGPDYPLGIRLSFEDVEGGLTPQDNARIVESLERDGLIDFVDVSAGSYFSFPMIIGGMHEPAGYELAGSAPIAAAARNIPRIVTGRFRTLEEADEVIASGVGDMVGLTRAHIADPDIVRKTVEGRHDEVRPCIACNQGCVGQVLSPIRRLGCTVNPYVGRELEISDDNLPRAPRKRRILVVGGGPAGMEAARISALRGHDVILAEAQSRLSGTINLAARAPLHQAIRDVTDWMEHEIYRLGVDVRLSTYVDPGDVEALSPDAVIVATGSLPRMDGIQMGLPGNPAAGMTLPHVLSSVDLFSGPLAQTVRTAVVVDDVGHYEAIAAAEHLLYHGVEVSFITRHRSFAPLLESALISEPALKRLSKGDFALHLRSHLVQVSEKKASMMNMDSGRLKDVSADAVVFISHNEPNRALADALVSYSGETHVVGDALSPRFLLRAIHEGNAAGCAV
ncbi:oxidoreductase [Rhizorhapis sp. SPR117]|uniref:oxidoreductase n=1 Tax=Rhizorhapis sp. SPR117 TaxID=2912611 RepID=UPI001F2B36E5|nr:FAD-dependent oxidoreductase [Rhizorhapis sp. SPR117]